MRGHLGMNGLGDFLIFYLSIIYGPRYELGSAISKFTVLVFQKFPDGYI